MRTFRSILTWYTRALECITTSFDIKEQEESLQSCNISFKISRLNLFLAEFKTQMLYYNAKSDFTESLEESLKCLKKCFPLVFNTDGFHRLRVKIHVKHPFVFMP